MKRFLKRCAAQALVFVYYATGAAYRTGNNGVSMVQSLREWADQ